MKVSFKLVDAVTGEKLGYSSATVVDEGGMQLGSGFVADADGLVEIDSPDLNATDTYIDVSISGYKEKYLTVAEATGTVKMNPNVKELENVTVRGKAGVTAAKPDYTIPVALVACGVVTIVIYFAVRP